MTDERELTAAQEGAIEAAEDAIQAILFDLEEKAFVKVESCEIDTRNFSQFRTSPFETPE